MKLLADGVSCEFLALAFLLVLLLQRCFSAGPRLLVVGAEPGFGFLQSPSLGILFYRLAIITFLEFIGLCC